MIRILAKKTMKIIYIYIIITSLCIGMLIINEKDTVKISNVQEKILAMQSVSKFKEIAPGRFHSMAIDNNGDLWVWGENTNGQIGDGTKSDSLNPKKIKEGTTFTKISAGIYHSMAIDSNGNLWTWGYNYEGQLGDGTIDESLIPKKIKEGTKFTEISAGDRHSMAIDSNGNLWAWGINYEGQLGNGTTSYEPNLTPIKIKPGTKFNQVKAAYQHTIALDTEGNIWTWGDNYYGQLGNGTTDDSYTPIKIMSGTSITKIYAGGDISMAIDSNRKFICMGICR